MTKEQNIRAIIDAHFSGYKDEIKDSAVARIMELEDEPSAEEYTRIYKKGWMDGRQKLVESVEKDIAT